MNHYSDFGSPVDSSTWIGYQDNIFRPDVSSFTLAEHGAHEVFEQRPVPIYTHQLFGEMPTQGVWNAHFICSTPIAAEAFPFAGGNGDGSGAPQIFDPRSTSATHQYDPHGNDNSPPTTPSAAAQVQAEATISKDMPRAVLDLKRRLDEQQARDRTSFNKLRGELAKLTSMATQLANSLSKHSTSPHTSTPAASAAAPASAVSQVFVEMPTPTSWQGTDGTAPNDCSGHHDPIQSTCVSNRSEQNLDYFLEQAAPETIFDVDDDKLDGRSNEFVPMFTATREQQINGVEQQEDDQPLKCFCKPPETEHNSACLYNLSDVQDFTFEVQPQDDKRACSDPVRKPSDSLAPRCSQLSIDQSMRDLKLQWDPGASAFLVAPLKNDSSKDFSSHNKTDLWSQYEHLLIVLRGVFDEVMLAKPPAKPPDWFGIVDSSLQDICFLPEVTPLAKHYLSILSQDTQEQDQLLKDNEQTSTYCSRASEHALNCQHSLMSTTVTPQVQSQAIERKPVYDAYNEEDNACLNSMDAVLVHNSEQQKVTNASFVWDPGTMLLLYKSKWWLLAIEGKINQHHDIKYYGVALWLIHFQPP